MSKNPKRAEKFFRSFMWELYNYGIISKRNRKVIQFDIEGNKINSFDNCNEAARYIGTASASATISRCCNGKMQSSKGYIWKYEAIVK